MDKTTAGYLYGVSMALISFLTAVFGTWTIRAIFECSEELRSPKRKAKSLRATNRKNDVLCPCLFGQLTTPQFLFGVTAACVMCFVGSALFYFSTYVLWLAICAQCVAQNKMSFWVTFPFVTSFAFGALAYNLMFVTHFERLRLTFKDTRYRLPHWAPNILYATMTLGFVLMALTRIYFTSVPLVAAVCILGAVMLYLVSASALIHAFFSKTMHVANSTEIDTSNLTDGALRVTVAATMSVLSSTLTWTVVSIIAVTAPNPIWVRTCANVLMTTDFCINCFCLLCTFRKATAYYQFVFKGLHSRCLSHLSTAVVRKVSSMTAGKIIAPVTILSMSDT